jgi:hypothetical protein
MPSPDEATSEVTTSSLAAGRVAPAGDLLGRAAALHAAGEPTELREASSTKLAAIRIEPPFGVLVLVVDGTRGLQRIDFPPEVIEPDVASAVRLIRDFAERVVARQ